MTNKNIFYILTLIVVVLLCVSTVSAVNSNVTMDNTILEENSNDESISLSNDERGDDIGEYVLSAQYDATLAVNDEKVLSADVNCDSCLGVSNSETNKYLDDICTSTSGVYYKFVNYLVKQKGFQFNTKSSNDGYSVYSNSNYQTKLYDGSNYVFPAKTSYFISKNRISYVIDELYPDALYVSNNNYVLDDLYVGWLKWTENYHPTLNIEGTNNIKSVISSQSSSKASSDNLPKSFDLRKVDGKYNYVTPIRSQERGNTCWAFASIAALESFLLKTEGKSYEFSNQYDFSENNMKNVMSSLGKQGIYARLSNDGGNDNYALAYLLRWSGPILEEYDNYYTVNGVPTNNIPLEFFNSEKHVQGVKYIHERDGSKDNDEIKKAIMDYGAVATSLFWNPKFVNGYNYYCYDISLVNPKTDGHAICIIGWDDNYKKSNFGKNAPPEDGAFIVKNSWGDSSGNDGYYYISYFDVSLAKRSMTEFFNKGAGFVFTSVEDKTNYGKNYNYNPQGVTFWIRMTDVNNNPAKNVAYYSQWIANSDDNLKACGVYVNNASECSIKVFVDNNLKGTTNNVVLPYAGFHTIQFSNMIPVKKGQKFRIEVSIKSENPVLLPAELSWLELKESNPKNYNNAHANADETGYISGDKLVDITNTYKTCNLCMNVYTEYKALLDTKIEVTHMSIFNFLIKDVTVKLSDSKNTILKNFDLTFCRGNDYKCVKTNSNGESSYVVNNGIGDYLCIYYLGSESYNYAFTPLKINMELPKNTPCEVIVNNNPQPTVNSPNLIPKVGIVELTSNLLITVLKISGISNGKTYSRTAKLDLSLNKKVDLKITLKIGSNSHKIKFNNGKCTLKLGDYKLDKKKSYKVKFSGGDTKYNVDQSLTIKTK